MAGRFYAFYTVSQKKTPPFLCVL